MSALQYIHDYGSSSDESIDENIKIPTKNKLHLPDLKNLPSLIKTEVFIDNPDQHGGRIRSFPHERGNWTSFVFIKYTEQDLLKDLIDKVERAITAESKDSYHRCEDFHISLSKTFVLKYHQIATFTNTLQEAFDDIECFDLEFSSMKVYCNEEQTRTFIAIEVDYFTRKLLLKITEKIDKVLQEFRLPVFYEVPSFHMSIFWLNGNRKTELVTILNKLNFFSDEINNILRLIVVNSINSKIGNKYYQFSLK